MKKILIILLAAAGIFASAAVRNDKDRSPQTIYIEQYSALAVEEMYRSGIPASITIAQGLLESRYGLSELAVKGNNHFGIKCHNWNGDKMYHDDDKRGECFRVYESPEQSFRDHSDFLRYRDRYKFLFDLEPSDYKGWAHGLKKAGYATDPSYPQKLIRLIEEYELYRFDVGGKNDEKVEEKAAEKSGSEKRREKRKRRAKEEPKVLPESPARLEQPKPLTNDQRETFHFALSRQMYSLNGVPFVYASDGETYASIAAANNLFLREILKFNDLEEETTLYSGTIVYLQPKKRKAAAGIEKYVVEGDNENMRDISQRFAVKLDRLCKMNGMTGDEILMDGEVILLR